MLRDNISRKHYITEDIVDVFFAYKLLLEKEYNYDEDNYNEDEDNYNEDKDNYDEDEDKDNYDEDEDNYNEDKDNYDEKLIYTDIKKKEQKNLVFLIEYIMQ